VVLPSPGPVLELAVLEVKFRRSARLEGAIDEALAKVVVLEPVKPPAQLSAVGVLESLAVDIQRLNRSVDEDDALLAAVAVFLRRRVVGMEPVDAL
jgi:hypothetical protein